MCHPEVLIAPIPEAHPQFYRNNSLAPQLFISVQQFHLSLHGEITMTAIVNPTIALPNPPIKQAKLYINGQWRSASDGKTRPTISPIRTYARTLQVVLTINL
jgi:hypothetical protein